MLTRTIEWLNANSHRRYPFRDDTSLVFTGITDGVLPDDVLLDFQGSIISADLTSQPAVKLLSFDVTTGESVLFHFSADSNTFFVSVPNAATLQDMGFQISGTTSGFCWTFIFGQGCSTLCQLATGIYQLTDTPEFQPTLTVVQNRHRVDTVKAVGAYHDTLDGVIYVEPGYNCNPLVKPGVVRLTAGQGLGAGTYCNPDDVSESCSNVLLWFNGQHADENGNVQLTGGQGVIVENYPELNLIVIRGSQVLANTKCG